MPIQPLTPLVRRLVAGANLRVVDLWQDADGPENPASKYGNARTLLGVPMRLASQSARIRDALLEIWRTGTDIAEEPWLDHYDRRGQPWAARVIRQGALMTLAIYLVATTALVVVVLILLTRKAK
jgi:hypothetical protein